MKHSHEEEEDDTYSVVFIEEPKKKRKSRKKVDRVGQTEISQLFEHKNQYLSADEIAKKLNVSNVYNQLKSMVKWKDVEVKVVKRKCGKCSSPRKVKLYRGKKK